MCDLPPEYYLRTDYIKAISMLQFPEKLCFECGYALWEEGIISSCIFDTQECHLCNHKYCEIHLSDHIDRRVCQQ